jgi:hypothetical protein
MKNLLPQEKLKAKSIELPKSWQNIEKSWQMFFKYRFKLFFYQSLIEQVPKYLRFIQIYC